MKTYFKLIASLTLLLIFVSMGCKPSEETATDDGTETVESDTSVVSEDEPTELQATLTQNRSRLNDIHSSQQHDMPKAFLKKDEGNTSLNSDPSAGYRVQIISTRDQQLADSVANEFQAWSDSTIAGYNAESYVSFNQPFYRVHIGDFQQRDQANSFSKLIKPEYPEAWVVHDRIEPSNVPADTATFSLKELEEEEADSIQSEETEDDKELNSSEQL